MFPDNKVLPGGEQEEIDKLQDFIGLPHQLALNRFTFECLFEPHAVLTGKNAPQILQIKNQIGKFNEKVKILDYGAGKGRLLANIIENSGDNLQEFTEKINYIAYDEFDGDKSDCKALLDKIYGLNSNRYFNNFENLHSYHKKSSFDIIVMSNVLHEIDPIDWLKLFSKDGDISSCLRDDGVLVLVEDTQIPVGEKAHRNGFIVLSTLQLNELFNMERSDFVDIQTERKDRLQCHVIPKRCLEQITPNSRISALRSVRDAAKAAIVRIRKDEINYDSGKLLGFYLQQFANASLALPELTVT